MKTLVHLSADPAFIDGRGQSALHSFVNGFRDPGRSLITDNASYEDIIRYLIEDCHIDPNLVGSATGSTALHDATQDGNIEVVKLLLQLGAFVDPVRHVGTVPNHYPSPAFHLYLGTIELALTFRRGNPNR
jgi:ankyrin repeat protein